MLDSTAVPGARGAAAGAREGTRLAGCDAPRELLAEIVAQAHACIAVVVGRELRFALVNPAYQAIAPGTPMVGRTYPEVFPDAAAAGAEAAFQRVLETGETWHVDRYRAPIPGEPDATWQGEVVLLPPDAAGQPRALVVIEDVTQRVRAEEALRASEREARASAAELQAVLDSVPAAVWIARDPSATRIDANRVGAEMLGVRPGRNVSVTAPAGERPVNFRAMRDGAEIPEDELPIQAAARFGASVRDCAIDLVFDDGRVRHVIGNASPILGEDGRPRGSVGAFVDITELKRAVDALREAERRKDEFLAMLSHELRNPLAGLRNSVLVLERASPESDRAQRARAVIRRQADHMGRLVDDLLDVTRIARGKIELRRERTDVRPVVSRAAEDFQAAMDQRGLELRWSVPDEAVWVDADATRLAQIVGNLLANAAKFATPGGRVEVTLRAGEGEARISVRDTGPGIDPALLPRIFEPFVQGETTLARGAGGLGLGLALVKGIAELHGGGVAVASGVNGEGTEFVVRLPLSGAPAARPSPPVAPPRAGRRVLVVDDNADAAQALADLLALHGHAVEVALDGPTAVARAVATRPEVVLCDIGLPGMSGYEVARALRAAGVRPLRLVALTGYAQPDDVARVLGAGFDAHLAKPADPDVLTRLLA
jgi:signal transduction histidine kinase/CheY-like chemotaxis protein